MLDKIKFFIDKHIGAAARLLKSAPKRKRTKNQTYYK